jgi:hypothetical protein
MHMNAHTQMFTVFGGSYVAENHDNRPTPQGRKNGSKKLAIGLALVLLGATAATAAKSTRLPDGFWARGPMSGMMVAHFEDAVY